MFGRLIDKLVFGAALIIALQIPQLADHYQQFMAGLYQSTQWQVQGYEVTAKAHQYADLMAMIEHHQHNEVASVRDDANQKLETLNQLAALKIGMETFEQGNLVSKSAYMFSPTRFDMLKHTLANFKLGIPLSLEGLSFAIIVALALNYLLMLPIFFIFRRKRRREIPQTIA